MVTGEKGTSGLTWAGVHGVPLHALSEREGGHVGVGVDALLHVAAPHTLGAGAGALAAGGPQSTGRSAGFGTVVGCGSKVFTPQIQPQIQEGENGRMLRPTWSFAQTPVDRVDAGLGLQAAGRRLGQVAAEAGVAGLAGQPLQTGVGEGRHVLPAPVGHVDLPEPDPGRHCGLVLQTHHSSNTWNLVNSNNEISPLLKTSASQKRQRSPSSRFSLTSDVPAAVLRHFVG